MKALIGCVIVAATCLFYTNADGQVKETADTWGWGHKVKPTEIDFTVEIIDDVAILAGVNRHREIAGTVGGPNEHRAVFVSRQDKMVMFDCLFFEGNENSTTPTGINNDGTEVGVCGSGTFNFVRRKGGSLYQFSVPGADQVVSRGVNDREEILVEYWMPFQPGQNSGFYRLHNAIRLTDGGYQEIKAPSHPDDLGFPRSLTRTNALGINNRRQVVGTYSTIFTPSNEAGQWSSFLYDNGQFTDLGQDFIPVAINNDGTILAQRTNGQFVLYDDGLIFTIAIPEPYKWNRITGLTDKGELYGVVRTGDRPSNLKFFNAIASPQ
jgi:probable HAF family extracellular repeat protein